MDTNLKSSENKRFSLTQKLEEKIRESSDHSKRLRNQYCGSPTNFKSHEGRMGGDMSSQNDQYELFQDVTSIL